MKVKGFTECVTLFFLYSVTTMLNELVLPIFILYLIEKIRCAFRLQSFRCDNAIIRFLCRNENEISPKTAADL